jgi:hypothetical protein
MLLPKEPFPKGSKQTCHVSLLSLSAHKLGNSFGFCALKLGSILCIATWELLKHWNFKTKKAHSHTGSSKLPRFRWQMAIISWAIGWLHQVFANPLSCVTSFSQNTIFLPDFLYPVDGVSLSSFCWIRTTYMVYISSGMSWRALWATLYKTQF